MLRNGSYGATAGGNGDGATGFFTQATKFLRRLRNSYGIYVTGTAKRQRQKGNGMVETRH